MDKFVRQRRQQNENKNPAIQTKNPSIESDEISKSKILKSANIPSTTLGEQKSSISDSNVIPNKECTENRKQFFHVTFTSEYIL